MMLSLLMSGPGGCKSETTLQAGSLEGFGSDCRTQPSMASGQNQCTAPCGKHPASRERTSDAVRGGALPSADSADAVLSCSSLFFRPSPPDLKILIKSWFTRTYGHFLPFLAVSVFPSVSGLERFPMLLCSHRHSFPRFHSSIREPPDLRPIGVESWGYKRTSLFRSFTRITLRSCLRAT
jgi:hypothetical protein